MSPPGLPTPSPTVRQDRLTVVETVYHQPTDDQPTAAESRFSRRLSSGEQPCVRKLRAGEVWQPVDRDPASTIGGWLAQAGMLVLRNEEGRFTQTVPTEEERAAAAARVLILGIQSVDLVYPFARILPGEESCRFQPVDLKSLRVRCDRGQARYTVYLFPV